MAGIQCGWSGRHGRPAGVVAALVHLVDVITSSRRSWQSRPRFCTTSSGISGGRGAIVRHNHRQRQLVVSLRFQVLNGTISLLGNVGVTAWFSPGLIGLDPIVSNLIAITVCSLLNFVFSEALVFSATSIEANALECATDRRRVAGRCCAGGRRRRWRLDARCLARLRGPGRLEIQGVLVGRSSFFALDRDEPVARLAQRRPPRQPPTIKIDAPSVDRREDSSLGRRDIRSGDRPCPR